MDWIKFSIWMLGTIGAVGILISIITFYKVWKGRRYKVFLFIVSMLLCANVGSLIEALGYAAGFKYVRLLKTNDFAAVG